MLSFNNRRRYAELSWTPVLTFATPGDLAVTYSAQIGDLVRVGNLILARFRIACSAFTHTTASGNLQVTGLPFASKSGLVSHATAGFTGVTKANYTQVNAFMNPGASTILFKGFGSAQTESNLVAADLPTGGTPILTGELPYIAAG